MSSIGSPSPFFLAGKKAFAVERSLRFDNNQLPLTRTPSSTSNRKTMTFSLWFKRAVDTNFNSFLIGYGNPSNRHGLDFVSGGQLRLWGNYNGSVALTVQPTQVFTDFAAWYHFVLAIDTTQGTASNRVKMYVNGSQITDFATANYPAQDFEFDFNNQYATTQIGSYSKAYFAEFQEIDGLALDPSYFGETDLITGQWNPKKYVGNYGTNGFYLNFSDDTSTSALGTDSSGNSNNFTVNNLSVTAGVDNDSVKDTPTNNFCTLNPLSNGTGANPSNGNLDFATTSSATGTMDTTIPISSGKWYCEVTIITGSNNGAVGIRSIDQLSTASDTLGSENLDYAYRGNGQKFNSNSKTSYGSSYTSNDVIGIALDLDGGTIKFFKNNSDQGTAFSSISGTYVFAIGDDNTSSAFNGSLNFGQRTFTYTPPSGFKTLCTANLPDPTILFPNKHFDTLLWTANASTQVVTGLNFQPDWVWGKSRDDTYDHEVYDSVRGPLKRLKPNSTGQELTNAQNLQSFNSAGGGTSGGFTLGSATNMNYNSGSDIVSWNWNAGDTDGKTYIVKVHDFSGNNRYIFDDFQTQAVTLDLAEGGTYIFNMDDASNASHPFMIGTTANDNTTAFSSGIVYKLDGVVKTFAQYHAGFAAATTRRLEFTIPASTNNLFYFCYVHSGMGGAINTNSTLGSSNFDGSTQTIVKANTTAGFSIVSYTGNDTSGSTIGHGLGAIPQITIIKRRIASEDWMFGIGHILGSGKEGHYVKLNATEPEGVGSGPFASTNSSSTVVTIGGDVAVNDNGEPYICYCFSEVAGYSKFGLYRGNGNADGRFIFTGFRPAFFMCKALSFTKGWRMTDSKRAPFNRIFKSLFPELTAAEYTSTGTNEQGQDFLSNGVKLRSTNTRDNRSGHNYFFMAFAESPFKNARAR
jgi:hypothetical protein